MVKTSKSVKAKPGFKKLAKAVASFTKSKNRRMLRRPGDRVYRKIPVSPETRLFAILDTVHDVFDRPTEKKNYQDLLLKHFPTEFTKKGMDIDSFVRIVYNFPNAMNLGGRKMKVFMYDKTLDCSPTFRFDQSKDSYMNILNKFLCINIQKKLSNLGSIKRHYLIQSLWRATKTTYILTQKTNICHLTSNKFSCQVMAPPQFLHFVETFGIHVAVDAEKYTKEELRTLNPNSMMLFGNSSNNKQTFKQATNINFIINPSQIVDPANTSKHGNMHFVFPPRTIVNNVYNLFGFQHSTNNTIIFQCNALNPQFTCDFQIFVEVPSIWKKVYPELFQKLSSNVMIKNTDLPFLQKNLRFYVISRLKDDKYAPYAPILCIQYKDYGNDGKVQFQNKHNSQMPYTNQWVIKDTFQGLSVQECYKMTNNKINFARNDIDKKWLIQHYLDWKRMGDSFQINMLDNIVSSYNSVDKINTVVYEKNDNKNPSKPTYEMIYYFFASNDLLAIIQAIKNKVPFIGEYQGNYFAGHTLLSNKVKGYNQLHGLIAQRSVKQKLNRSNSNRRASGLSRTLSRQNSNTNRRLTRTPSRQNSIGRSNCPPCRPCPPCREYMYNQTLTSLPPRKRLRPSRYQS